MTVYHCFLIDNADRVQGVGTIETQTQADAIYRSERMLRAEFHAAAIEIWEHGRLIRHIERENFQEQHEHQGTMR